MNNITFNELVSYIAIAIVSIALFFGALRTHEKEEFNRLDRIAENNTAIQNPTKKNKGE